MTSSSSVVTLASSSVSRMALQSVSLSTAGNQFA
jgi:hypothetical protein